MALFCLCFQAAASTVISGTLSITNYAALTNATSGQSYTLNGATRTFTNSVASAATQIKVRTNDSAATILLSIAAQAGSYPFANVPGMTASNGTNLTFRATNDTALVITLSPSTWGKVTYSTQTVGTVQTVVRVPLSAEDSGIRASIASQLWSDLDAYSTARQFSGALTNTGAVKLGSTLDVAGRAEFDAGLGLHGLGLIATNYTLRTNDIYVGVDTRSNTNLILTLPSAASASNLLFVIKDEGGSGATNTVKIYPAAGDRIDTLLTNLVVSNNFGGVMLRSRGSTNWAILASGGGVTGGIAGSGITGVALTNSVWVAKNGSDSTGARGDPSKAFLTLGAAKTNASSGDTIFVMPGVYAVTNTVNKNGVNWHLFNGATFSNVNDSVAIFDFSVTAGSFNVTGDGTFLDITNGFGGVVYCDDAGSTASFKFKRMWSDGCPVIVSAGTITLSGDIIESDSNIGAQGATRIGGAGAVVTILHTRVIANGSGATAHAITYSTGNTNLLLKDCTLQAGGNASAKAINGSGTAKISIEGTLAANAPISGVTMQNATNLTTIPGTLLLPGTNNVSFLRVTNSAVIPTNTAPFTIDVTDFVLDTNYTNGTQRAWVSAPILLSANAADTAQVALYLDQDADTAFEQTGNTASANGLVTNTVPLNAYLQPGAVFIFTNLSTGAATAAVNAGGSQWVKQ